VKEVVKTDSVLLKSLSKKEMLRLLGWVWIFAN